MLAINFLAFWKLRCLWKRRFSPELCSCFVPHFLIYYCYFIQFSFAVISTFTNRLTVFVMLSIFFCYVSSTYGQVWFLSFNKETEANQDFFAEMHNLRERSKWDPKETCGNLRKDIKIMFLGDFRVSWRILIRKVCTGIRLVTPAGQAIKIFAMLSVMLILLLLKTYPARNTNKKGKNV